MRILKKVSQKEVWNYWRKTEKLSGDSFRSDIRDPLPDDITWYLASVEEGDIDNLYVISSDDWKDISQGTFLVKEVDLNSKSKNSDTKRIIDNIKEKITYLDNGGRLDGKLVAVTTNSSGPFTFIEGNRRAVAFLSRKELVGTELYLGFSDKIRHYTWARYAYNTS